MKNTLTTLLLLTAFFAQAQVGIGVATGDMAPSAQLEVKSTTKGFLPPRMLASERALIDSPTAGLLVFQTDAPVGLYYYTGSAWTIVNSASAGGSYLPLTGGTLTGDITVNGAYFGTKGVSSNIVIGDTPATNQGIEATAIGKNAGYDHQSNDGIAIGTSTGQYYQGLAAISIGTAAGTVYQGEKAITLGYLSGYDHQGASAIAIGNESGRSYQSSNTIALGNFSGKYSQGTNAIAIGQNAGVTSQHANSIVLNASGTTLDGNTNAGLYVDPIRNASGSSTLFYDATTKEITYGDATGGVSSIGDFGTPTDKGASITTGVLSLTPADATHGGILTTETQTIAGDKTFNSDLVINGASFGTKGNTGSIVIGSGAGATNQGTYSVAIGPSAANDSQGNASIAIGFNAGKTNQGIGVIALGVNAGKTNQDHYSIAIGNSAGISNQGNSGIALGSFAGSINQGSGAFAAGSDAGFTGQNANAIAIGTSSGYTSQQSNAIALGASAGNNYQALNAIAVGNNAGNYYQSATAIAIGSYSGQISQSEKSIAIGEGAGNFHQGENSVAIGAYAGNHSQPANSIILNANGLVLNASNSGLYVNPIRSASGRSALFYDSTTKEITYASSGTIGCSVDGAGNLYEYSSSSNVFSVLHTPGSGYYVITISESHETIIPMVSLMNVGIATVNKYVSNEVIVATYDTTGTPTDESFYLTINYKN